ncbi:hypothetical protein [Labedella endophytica]|uniref:Lipoprotein n=1 Tax=Labedella endophytica TaxID=1523160 RepID=A0A433JP75_9MICO|nr:hypothetical protein [Labedella endophytica]RUQ98270.1 hypothetical protein ELQ94_14795 [Labedella endophytica]
MNSTRTRRTTLSLTLATTAVAALALSGCSLQQTLQKESSGTYADSAALSAEWDKTAPWLPADATDISVHESTEGDPASLLATSDTDLDLSKCAEVDRQSAPTFAIDGAPDAYKIDTVFACGDWAVAPTDDGWYGWTPNHPDEKAASPAQ